MTMVPVLCDSDYGRAAAPAWAAAEDAPAAAIAGKPAAGDRTPAA